ncbi:hypothetical protein GCM10025858_28980 [Alicyclobacillus sacchari]|nr:hypothetical protein GCM10025858_28980 [Alicyclobacillus sacchari]
MLGHIFADAGLPKGVLNIIPGDGKELSEVLTTHPDVAYVTFTAARRWDGKSAHKQVCAE